MKFVSQIIKLMISLFTKIMISVKMIKTLVRTSFFNLLKLFVIKMFFSFWES